MATTTRMQTIPLRHTNNVKKKIPRRYTQKLPTTATQLSIIIIVRMEEADTAYTDDVVQVVLNGILILFFFQQLKEFLIIKV